MFSKYGKLLLQTWSLPVENEMSVIFAVLGILDCENELSPIHFNKSRSLNRLCGVNSTLVKGNRGFWNIQIPAFSQITSNTLYKIDLKFMCVLHLSIIKCTCEIISSECKPHEISKNTTSHVEGWIGKQPLRRDHIAYRGDSWRGM